MKCSEAARSWTLRAPMYFDVLSFVATRANQKNPASNANRLRGYSSSFIGPGKILNFVSASIDDCYPIRGTGCRRANWIKGFFQNVTGNIRSPLLAVFSRGRERESNCSSVVKRWSFCTARWKGLGLDMMKDGLKYRVVFQSIRSSEGRLVCLNEQND